MRTATAMSGAPPTLSPNPTGVHSTELSHDGHDLRSDCWHGIRLGTDCDAAQLARTSAGGLTLVWLIVDCPPSALRVNPESILSRCPLLEPGLPLAPVSGSGDDGQRANSSNPRSPRSPSSPRFASPLIRPGRQLIPRRVTQL